MAFQLFSINDLFKILDFIENGTTDETITEVIQALAKSEQARSERYISNVIDQIPFRSADYTRTRNFLRDWYSSHKTMTSLSKDITDPRTLRNSHLDELFRSFGYPYSTPLRRYDETPPEIKVNFFLDLVNLYKIKGTPRSIFEALQYYGIQNLNIFEFWIQKQTASSLIFRGDTVLSTLASTSQLLLPLPLLLGGDPHWFQSESQILTLNNLNQINLPSKTPYIGIQPLGEIGPETAIVFRLVQDQYDDWNSTGNLPTQNAEITTLGTVASLLELYLSCIHQFERVYTDYGYPGSNYFCYDGTNTNVLEINDEFYNLISTKPTSRSHLITLHENYYDLFTREKSRNFLQNRGDAGAVLNSINSTLKSQLDSFGGDQNLFLTSLITDLANWVRNFVGLGFINYSSIIGGADSVLGQIQDVANFFKPYRARVFLLEAIVYNNRILNSIVTEDETFYGFEQRFHDFITGDSKPCCTDPYQVCPDSTALLYYSRNTYDCGSYYDIGAVTDIRQDLQYEEDVIFEDALRCPRDSTGPVFSEILSSGQLINIAELTNGQSLHSITYNTPQIDSTYSLVVNLVNEDDVVTSKYNYVITSKTTTGFDILFSDPIDSANYKLTYIIKRDSLTGQETIANGVVRKTVTLPAAQAGVDYSLGLSLVNTADATSSIYGFVVVEKTTTSFTVEFSGPIDSNNYILNWIIFDETNRGEETMPSGVSSYEVVFPVPEADTNYASSIDIVNTIDSTPSIFAYIVTQKNAGAFTVEFSAPLDSANYKISWAVTPSETTYDTFTYYQSGNWHDFDTEGRFDCTHGFDLVFIDLLPGLPAIQLENGEYLLQENGGRLLLD